MSYLRYGSIYKYVDGVSNDYIFPTDNKIEDYGSLSNESIIELLFQRAIIYDTICPEFSEMLTEHIIRRLAENLKVKLRKKPLTNKQLIKLQLKDYKKEMINNEREDK